jgi:hypothetical protein
MAGEGWEDLQINYHFLQRRTERVKSRRKVSSMTQQPVLPSPSDPQDEIQAERRAGLLHMVEARIKRSLGQILRTAPSSEDSGEKRASVSQSRLTWENLRRIFLFHDRDLSLYVIGTLAVVIMSLYAYALVDSGRDSFFVQIEGLFLALLWLTLNARNVKSFLAQIKLKQPAVHPAWLLVSAALFLRWTALSIFPPVNQTGFEEVQTGAVASNIILTGALPIEFRFTNIIAALGLSIEHGSPLSSMRYPFQIAGLISLVLLAFSLRSFKVSWFPTVFVVFLAATLRYLVMASGLADELFAGIPFLTAFLLLVIKPEYSENRTFWLAAAGILGGMLMFEYISYRVPVLVFWTWLLWKCIHRPGNDGKSSQASVWLDFFSFSVALVLVALPTFVEVFRHHRPDHSIFLEAFFRHGNERGTIFTREGASLIKDHVLGLIGMPTATSPYYTPLDETFLPPLVGMLFGLAFLFGLFFSGRGLPRVLAIIVILTTVGAGLFANNFNIGRTSPLFPILLILSGILLEKVYQKIRQWFNVLDGAGWKTVSFVLKTLAAVAYVLLVYQMSRGNFSSLEKMAEAPEVRTIYTSDDYSVCDYIGTVTTPGQHVYIYSPEGVKYCAPTLPEAWYYGNKNLKVQHLVKDFITPDQLAPGDLVVMVSNNRGLNDKEMSQLTDLGFTTKSLNSFQFGRNLAGKITAASICFQCSH